MIAALRLVLLALSLLFAYFFGDTMEQFLLQVIRLFIAVDPSNAIRFNLVHTAIILFPLALLGVFLTVATIDDRALRRHAQRIASGMFLSLFLYRLFQVWWILKTSALSDQELSGHAE